jgi:hypothetical protein
MKKLIYLSFLLLLMMLSGCVNIIAEEFVTFGIFVESSAGQPITDARVEVTIIRSASVDEEVTGTTGCATLGGINIAEGEYGLNVSAQGYKTLEHRFTRETTNYFTITLAEENGTTSSSVKSEAPNAQYKFDKCPTP